MEKNINTFFKIRSKDRQLWYGTFKEESEAKKHMSKNWPNEKDWEIIEVDCSGLTINKTDL